MANEKRLIDANTLKEKAFAETETGEGVVYVQDIDEAPTVDAVEVERYIELREQYDRLFQEYHELRDNFISYVCSGIPNPSPFCLNKRRGCCDSRGWCKNNDKCQGFNPAEVILGDAKMDGDGNG